MRRRDVLRAVGVLPLSATGGAAAQSDFGPLGSVDLRGAKEAVVGPDGTTVFVAVTDGFAVVDVTDPAAPTVIHENRDVLADHPDGPLEGIYDAKVDGDRLAVTGPANHGPRLRAAVVFDVTNPAAPERVSVHETDFFNHNCDVDDGTVYLCGNDGRENALVTVDAETGEWLGSWSVTSLDEGWRDVRFIHWPIHDVSVHDGVAYLAQWDAGTYMVDVSEPANPEHLATVRSGDPAEFADLSDDRSFEMGRQPPGNDHFVTVDESGDLLGISIEAWDVDPPEEDVRPGGIHLFDVSNPESPEKLSLIEAPPSPDERFEGVWTTSHNFEFHEGRLYTSWYRGGVKVFDLADPTAPRELAAWRDSETTSFWTAQATANGFVGSSRKDPSQMPEDASGDADGPGAALFTFPDPPAPTPTATASESPSPHADQPGFGPLAALGALGVGAFRYLRREE